MDDIFTIQLFRNVYRMPSGQLYIPLNAYETIEEAKKMGKDRKHGEESDIFLYTIAETVHVIPNDKG